MVSGLIEPLRSTICQCFPALKDGLEWNVYIGEWFGDCVYTPREYFSFALGLLTIVLNFISLGPQIWLNFKNKATDGLSVSLLLLWLIGDAFSLVGGILTDQLVTQKILAFYFVILDSITIFQCWYYAGPPVLTNPDEAIASGEINPEYSTDIPLQTYSSNLIDLNNTPSGFGDLDNEFGTNTRDTNDDDDEAELEKLLADPTDADLSPLLTSQQHQQLQQHQNREVKPGNTGKIKGKGGKSALVTSTIGVVAMIAFLGLINISSSSSSSSSLDGSSTTKLTTIATNAVSTLPSCVRQSNASDFALFAGIIISWFSAFLFCGARIPQIINNFEFHKLGIPLDGLSPAVFFITALGNLAYGISVILRNTIDREFFITTFPFLLGSLGTIVFDIIILIQIHTYNKDFHQRKTAVHTSSRFGEDEL